MKKLLTIGIALGTLLIAGGCDNEKYTTWQQYRGSNENIHYSVLKQVDTNNVARLKVAWEYHTRDADTVNKSQIQCNPIIVDSVMYGTTSKMKLFAIDAATGKEKWRFDPAVQSKASKAFFFVMNNCRGVAYWADRKDKRIYYSAGSFMYAVNATDGQLVKSFGKDGKIDLHDGLDRDVKDFFVTNTSPPIIYKDIMVVGSRVDEGAQAAPGHIRAFDVRTGKRKWIFHTIPYPGEPGYESWKDKNAYKFIGGANAWGGFSLDKNRGIVFACTGSASYDFYGGKRLGNNLYADCVLALDINTGKLKWHFQDVHHDVWDKDIPAPPMLVRIRDTDAVAVTTKTGFIFAFNRETGEPMYDIKETRVPAKTDLEGEELSYTQPIPTKPASFMRQGMTEKDINPFLPDSSLKKVKAAFAKYHHDNVFSPISLEGTIVFPGLDGGAEWGGPSYDPETGVLYVNANEMAWIIQATKVQTKAAANETNLQAGERIFMARCMTCHGADRKGSGNFPSLINAGRKYKPAAFDTLIQTGRRMMPAFKQLMPNERKALASFILGLKTEQPKAFVNDEKKVNDVYNLPYSIVGYNKFVTTDGTPAISPPWGTLNAVDLNTGKYLWKIPLGDDPEFPHGGIQSGTENYGASVITKGGLLFIAATKDGKFRAFNKRTGKLLWEVTLPAPGFATPAIYETNGKQYIVIACGGGKMGTRSGDSYVAYALPDND